MEAHIEQLEAKIKRLEELVERLAPEGPQTGSPSNGGSGHISGSWLTQGI
jgi:hypothetical protein